VRWSGGQGEGGAQRRAVTCLGGVASGRPVTTVGDRLLYGCYRFLYGSAAGRKAAWRGLLGRKRGPGAGSRARARGMVLGVKAREFGDSFEGISCVS
jgi:hypothetical protein